MYYRFVKISYLVVDWNHITKTINNLNVDITFQNTFRSLVNYFYGVFLITKDVYLTITKIAIYR